MSSKVSNERVKWFFQISNERTYKIDTFWFLCVCIAAPVRNTELKFFYDEFLFIKVTILPFLSITSALVVQHENMHYHDKESDK